MATVHPKRGTIVPVRATANGYVATEAPLERFLKYCLFDPTTGCVLWTGGTATGRGNTAPYGVFWYERRRWFAHRWAAVHIHELEIDGFHVDHCCDLHRAGPEPLAPNTLCVQHVRPRTARDNSLDRWERQNWLLTGKGLRTAPPAFSELAAPGAAPFHEPPPWLALDTTVKSSDDDCPF